LLLQLKLGTVPLAHFQVGYGVDLRKRFTEQLAAMAAAGWPRYDEQSMRLTRAGLLRADWLVRELYLPEHRGIRYAWAPLSIRRRPAQHELVARLRERQAVQRLEVLLLQPPNDSQATRGRLAVVQFADSPSGIGERARVARGRAAPPQQRPLSALIKQLQK